MTAPEYGTQEFKSWWLDFWGYADGTAEAEEAWTAKVALMEGRQTRFAPMVFIGRDIHYTSPVDGRVIRSKAERLDDLARHGCIEYDPGMKQDYARRQKEADAAIDSGIERTVEETIHKMPSAKRERLANELSSGLDVQPVRLTATGG